MRNKIIFTLSFIGVIVGCIAAYYFSVQHRPKPPVFNPAPNPYAGGIYEEGILESDQPSGENINVYPEVPGTVKRIFVTEGESVKQGTPLLQIDDSIQKATVQQQTSQAHAALSLLQELKAEPRPENLRVAEAQVRAAQAALKTAEDSFNKQNDTYKLEQGSISKDALDSAKDAVESAKANLEVARKQYELTKAGAWVYDIKNQERQYHALQKSAEAGTALLAKYSLKAPNDGTVLSINAAVGSFVSPQGAYETYTKGMSPVLVLGSTPDHLDVRCYVDEILVPRLPSASKMKATMFIRGSSLKVPLHFLRVQPYVSPKIELSDAKAERVDVRVLPIIFKVEKQENLNLYPGQLVDVYIGGK